MTRRQPTQVTVRGSIQCPYYVHRALKVSFGLPDEQVRVIQAETGGAFGGKEDYPSLLAGHAALLAMKAGCPVKMIYDRGEDMASTTKRHPSRTRHRTAVSKEGKLLAADVEIVIDGGAYATLVGDGVLAGDDPRVRAVPVAGGAGALAGGGDEQSAVRGVSRIRRAAVAVCAGAAHGQDRTGVGLAPEELRRRNFHQDRRDDVDGPD